MPHDANGNLLKIGDKVSIPGKITLLTTSDEYCNCTVELDYSMPPYTPEQKTSFSFNTKQVLLSAVQEVPSPAPGAPAPPVEATAPEEAPSGSN